MKRILWITCFMFCFLSPFHVVANNKETFILVVVPDFSFTEMEILVSRDNGQSIWRNGTVAAVNVRPDGRYSHLNNLVSLSIGTKGSGMSDWNSFERGEKLEDERVETLVARWQGNVPRSSLLHPYFYQLASKNETSTYGGELGRLGEELKAHQVKCYVMGHSDLGSEQKKRYASLFTIDLAGRAEGLLHEVVDGVVTAPFGMKMNQQKIIQFVDKLETESDRSLIVIEWGDFHRLFQQQAMMKEAFYQEQYEQTLTELETFIHKLTQGERAVFLLSPNVNSTAYREKNQLAPLWAWRAGEEFGLHSLTSKQKFIIPNVDIAPTILQFFQIQQPETFIGKPLLIEHGERAEFEEIFSHLDWLFTIFSSRGTILSVYICFLVLLIITSGIFLWRRSDQVNAMNVIKTVLLAAALSPFTFLVTTFLQKYVQMTLFIILIVSLTLLVGFLFMKFIRRPFILIGWLHLLALSLDLLLGSPFIQRSLLGYDPIIGARYYGIGNEFAGVYIVSGLLAMLPIIHWQDQRRKFIVMGAFSLAMLYFLGASHLGTNAGAMLSAGIACIYLFSQAFRSVLNKRLIYFVSLIAMICLLLALFLLQKTGKPTHIGFAFERLFAGDFAYIVNIIKRKLAMNWKIFRFSNWTQLFVTSYLVIGLLLWRRKNTSEKRAERIVIETSIVASIALLLLNDSGVVAAATSMFMIVTAWYYWLLEKRMRLGLNKSNQ